MFKKLFYAAVAAIAAFAVGNLAYAGDYHAGSSLVCSDCHNMHYSGDHDYSGGAAMSLGAGGPFAYLLKDDRSTICLFCHNAGTVAGDGAPDVLADKVTAYSRSAGAANMEDGSTDGVGYQKYKGHSIGYNGGPPAHGGAWSTTAFACSDCHEPHGVAAQYRNLKTQPGDAAAAKNVTYANAVDGTKDLNQTALTPSATQYASGNMDWREPTTTASAIGAWCSSCHDTVHGAGGAANMGGASGGDPNNTGTTANAWKRHPTADVNIGANSNKHSDLTGYWDTVNDLRVMDADGTAGNADDTPTCVSCHRAHGSSNAFGLIFDARGTAGLTESGDGTAVQDLCRNCHNKP